MAPRTIHSRRIPGLGGSPAHGTASMNHASRCFRRTTGWGPRTVVRAVTMAAPACLLSLTATSANCDQRPLLSLTGAPEAPPIEAGMPAVAGEYDLAANVLHYDVELSLDGGAVIEGRATLTVDPNGERMLPLDFTGLGIRGVEIGGSPVRFAYGNGKLTVPLPTDADGSPVRITVVYHGTPDDGLIIRDNVHGHPTAFVDNWPNRTRFWLPSVDHPSDKATASFTVHAPASWQVIANGAPMGPPTPTDSQTPGGGDGKRTWRWATDVDHPSYTLVVGAADFVVESLGRGACGLAPASPDADGCVDVSFWAYPEDIAFARRVFARAPQMVDYYARVIGPYPFEKLANVQSATRFGGMENSSAIFYSERAIAQGQLSEGTVAHEIAHQWFGDGATQSDWMHLWLSEGFATYFGALFFEAADGVDDFRARMEQNRQRYVASDVVGRPIIDESGPGSLFDLLNSNNYQKGAWVLHMLRGIVGDSAFFPALRTYYGEHRYGNALTGDLRRVVERSTGEELQWFFDQWVRRPGYPILASEWSMSEDGRALELTLRQTQSFDWPTFRLPMDLEIQAPRGPTRHKIEMTQREQQFSFAVTARPDSVVLDPDGWVLKGSR